MQLPSEIWCKIANNLSCIDILRLEKVLKLDLSLEIKHIQKIAYKQVLLKLSTEYEITKINSITHHGYECYVSNRTIQDKKVRYMLISSFNQLYRFKSPALPILTVKHCKITTAGMIDFIGEYHNRIILANDENNMMYHSSVICRTFDGEFIIYDASRCSLIKYPWEF